MTMSEVNKGGRPREEPTNVRSVRLPNRGLEVGTKGIERQSFSQ